LGGILFLLTIGSATMSFLHFGLRVASHQQRWNNSVLIGIYADGGDQLKRKIVVTKTLDCLYSKIEFTTLILSNEIWVSISTIFLSTDNRTNRCRDGIAKNGNENATTNIILAPWLSTLLIIKAKAIASTRFTMGHVNQNFLFHSCLSSLPNAIRAHQPFEGWRSDFLPSWSDRGKLELDYRWVWKMIKLAGRWTRIRYCNCERYSLAQQVYYKFEWYKKKYWERATIDVMVSTMSRDLKIDRCYGNRLEDHHPAFRG